MPLAGQIVAHEIAGTIKEVNESAWQISLQPNDIGSKRTDHPPYAAAVIDKDSAMELYAGFGKSVYTAFATIGGNAVGVVATGKQLCHNCVAKASRFVRLCDAFSVPVITIVDTEGFVPSATASHLA